jgi:hypothetical protein
VVPWLPLAPVGAGVPPVTLGPVVPLEAAVAAGAASARVASTASVLIVELAGTRRQG